MIQHYRKKYLLIIIIVMLSLVTHSQKLNTLNVAILLYNDVELLDFAGPAEVFSGCFNVYLVTKDGKPITSMGFAKVDPNFSIDKVPSPDIIVLPGGRSVPTSDEKILDWIKTNQHRGTYLMSVCNGIYMLTKTGLLENKTITTHHGAMAGLQEEVPSAKVLKNSRYIDNGDVITTAGVSAGIDGALYVVSRIKGIKEARRIAEGMEYHNWEIADGHIGYQNEYIGKLRSQALDHATGKKVTAIRKEDIKVIPYEGEFENSFEEFRKQNKLKEAIYVLETALKFYPGSFSFYNNLAQMYKANGMRSPSTSETYKKMFAEEKVDEAIALYDADQKLFPGWKIIEERDLIGAAYESSQKKMYKNAIAILAFGLKLYPNSSALLVNVGIAYENTGDKKAALDYYQKALAVDPANERLKTYADQLQKEISGN